MNDVRDEWNKSLHKIFREEELAKCTGKENKNAWLETNLSETKQEDECQRGIRIKESKYNNKFQKLLNELMKESGIVVTKDNKYRILTMCRIWIKYINHLNNRHRSKFGSNIMHPYDNDDNSKEDVAKVLKLIQKKRISDSAKTTIKKNNVYSATKEDDIGRDCRSSKRCYSHDGSEVKHLKSVLQAMEMKKILPKYDSSVICPSCKTGDKVEVHRTVQIRRAGDEPMTIYYRCKNHKPQKVWKV